MDLARLAVPAIGEDLVAGLGGDRVGVRNAAILEVGESLALFDDAAFFLAELVFLRVGRVPDVVDVEVGDGEEGGEPRGQLVLGGVVVGDEEGAVAVRQGHAGHVPEDEHEAQFLVVHVPGRDDEVLALCAGADVQVVRE